jgi:hypothetical protein
MKCEHCQHEEINKRTSQQNRALYKYFALVSDEARNSGITFSDFIRTRKKLDMPWTPERVKEVWKTAQEYMYKTKSTAQLTTKQIDEVYDVVNKALGEIMGFSIPFPSIENLIELENKEL